MTDIRKLAAFAILCGFIAACGGPEEDDDDKKGEDGDRISVSGGITEDTIWKSENTYVLETHVFVQNAKLTIEPGTTILGKSGSSLVITNTATIDARGERSEPIVFTSAKPAGSRAAGDWGGVVLLGKAPLNVTGGVEKIEGFPASHEATSYGGDDPEHDCGTIRYARIEFAGFELAPDNELNSLTVGGCGSKTTLEYIQAHLGNDDGIEFFGGTADLKYAVMTQNDDDSLDWDYGWSGRAQFVVIQQNALVGDKGIEADNNGNAHDASPRSSPTIYNLTMIGSNAEPGEAGKTQAAIHFRRGTAGKLHNVIVSHFTDYAIDIDGAATVAQAESGALYVKDSIFFDNANETTGWPAEPTDNDGGFDEGAFFLAAAMNNRTVDPQLEAPLNLDAPNFAPRAGSPALTGGAAAPDDGFFDASATFVGAIGTDDWTAGWTAYPAD